MEYVHCCQLTCLNGYSLAKTRLKSKPAFFPTENEKIDLQERRELYDLESLWTVGAEFDDATRLHIFESIGTCGSYKYKEGQFNK